MDVTKEWVYQRWPRKSTALSELDLLRRARAAGHRHAAPRPGRFAHVLLRRRRPRAADFVPRPNGRHDATRGIGDAALRPARPSRRSLPASSSLQLRRGDDVISRLSHATGAGAVGELAARQLQRGARSAGPGDGAAAARRRWPRCRAPATAAAAAAAAPRTRSAARAAADADRSPPSRLEGLLPAPPRARGADPQPGSRQHVPVMRAGIGYAVRHGRAAVSPSVPRRSAPPRSALLHAAAGRVAAGRPRPRRRRDGGVDRGAPGAGLLVAERHRARWRRVGAADCRAIRPWSGRRRPIAPRWTPCCAAPPRSSMARRIRLAQMIVGADDGFSPRACSSSCGFRQARRAGLHVRRDVAGRRRLCGRDSTAVAVCSPSRRRTRAPGRTGGAHLRRHAGLPRPRRRAANRRRACRLSRPRAAPPRSLVSVRASQPQRRVGGDDLGVLILAEHPSHGELGARLHGRRSAGARPAARRADRAVSPCKRPLRAVRSGWCWPSTRPMNLPREMYRRSGFFEWDRRIVYARARRMTACQSARSPPTESAPTNYPLGGVPPEKNFHAAAAVAARCFAAIIAAARSRTRRRAVSSPWTRVLALLQSPPLGDIEASSAGRHAAGRFSRASGRNFDPAAATRGRTDCVRTRRRAADALRSRGSTGRGHGRFGQAVRLAQCTSPPARRRTVRLLARRPHAPGGGGAHAAGGVRIARRVAVPASPSASRAGRMLPRALVAAAGDCVRGD